MSRLFFSTAPIPKIDIRVNQFIATKIWQGDSLKSYIGYFQSQLAKFPNCRKDVSALASSVSCRFLTPIQASTRAWCHSNERGSIPRLTLHLIEGSNEELRQPFRQTRRWRRKVQVIVEATTRAMNLNRGQTRLQKTDAPGSSSSLRKPSSQQTYHSPQAPYNEVFNVIKDLETNLVRFYISRRRTVSFLSRR